MINYYVVIPKAIDFHKLIERKPAIYKNLDLNIVKGILGQFTRYLALKIDMEKINLRYLSNYKVSLDSKELKFLYGNGYKLALQFLHRDVLFKYPYTKEECFSFSYSPLITRGGFKIEKIKGDKKTSRTIIEKLVKKENKIKSKTRKRFQFLIKFFEKEKLKIDTKSAFQDVLHRYFEDNNVKRLLSSSQKIVDITNGVFNITCNPDTDGRLHSNFVRLNKDLRQYLTYDNKKLVEIDVSNSIPFILSTLLNSSIHLDSTYLNNKIFNSLSYKFHKHSLNLNMTEIEQFHLLSANGKIYESLIKEFSESNVIEMKTSHIDENGTQCFSYTMPERKKVKRQFLSMIFARNKHYKNMQEVFCRHYPSITEHIQRMKRKYYKKMSHFLFQVESYVMLEQIARGFNKNQRGRTPIFTIHDCIVTTEDKADELYNYMVQKFIEIFKNKQPQLKLELWQKN